MAGIGKQIVGSFEQIGKDVAKQTATVPKDIAGKALESLGASSGPQKQQGGVATGSADATKMQEGALGEMEKTQDQKVKQSLSREALAQFAKPKPKEKTIWDEKLEAEKQKLEQKKREEAAKAAELKPMGSKRPKGDLYGTKAKKLGSEVGKNVRQD